MRYQIQHQTIYQYNQGVYLQPHLLRLKPRSDAWQTLKTWRWEMQPTPAGRSEVLDLDGNTLIKVWFTEPTQGLQVQTWAEVETHITNPFQYLLEPWAIRLPWDYPHRLYGQLQPYLKPYGPVWDPIALALGQEITVAVGGDVNQFLWHLCQHLYAHCTYEMRETGDPHPPGYTWQQKRGACRDLAVLMLEVCRSQGIAARFVSGYQEGDPDQDDRHLHGWIEVYCPGAGWRGYDPSHGLAVSDRHIALVASPDPRGCGPISGAIQPHEPFRLTGQPVQTQMMTQLQLNPLGP